jgi:hypothetical protein
MTIRVRPSRRGNFERTGARLTELGIRYVGYDHSQGCYVDAEIPPALEATLRADPLIEVLSDDAPAQRRGGPIWGSKDSVLDLPELGERLRRLRQLAGLDLARAAALTKGVLSAEAIERMEQTGECDIRAMIVLADTYAASLDQIAGRTVLSGSRRR